MTWRRSSGSSIISFARCRARGRVVVNATEDSLQRVLAQGCWSELARFGAGGEWQAAGSHDAFDVLRKGERVGRVEWALSGLHNQMNALAAIAAAEHVGVAPAAAAEALGSFRNVRRRMELRGTVVRRAKDRSPSTTISRTIRRPSAPRSMACATSSMPMARKVSASSQFSSRAATP